jgi:hypothetical protein
VATFRLFARCQFCDEGHPFPFAISLPLESSNNGCVGEIYNGKQTPRDIVNIVKNKVACTSVDKYFVQEDLNQVFLVQTA